MRIDPIDARRLAPYLPIKGGWMATTVLALILAVLTGTEWWAYANGNTFVGLTGYFFFSTLFISILFAVSRAEFNGTTGTALTQPWRWLVAFWKRNVVGYTLGCTLWHDDALTWSLTDDRSITPPRAPHSVTVLTNLSWGTCHTVYPSGCPIKDPNAFDLSVDYVAVTDEPAILMTVTMRDTYRPRHTTNPMPVEKALRLIRSDTEPQRGRAAR